MLQEISSYLSQNTTAEFQAAVSEAFDLFDQFNLETYDIAYLDLIASADTMEPTGVYDTMRALTRQYQDHILLNMGIVLSEETSMKEANSVLRALALLPDTELRGEIENLCNDAPDSQEALCAILALLLGEEEENYYEVVLSVEGSFLERVCALMQMGADPEDDDAPTRVDPVADEEKLEKLRAYKAMSSGKPLIIWDHLGEGVPVGLEFTDYYVQLIEKIRNDTAGEIAHQLYGAFLVSSQAGSNPRGVILEDLNKTFNSVDRITSITQVIETTILKFHARLTSGVKKETA